MSLQEIFDMEEAKTKVLSLEERIIQLESKNLQLQKANDELTLKLRNAGEIIVRARLLLQNAEL